MFLLSFCNVSAILIIKKALTTFSFEFLITAIFEESVPPNHSKNDLERNPKFIFIEHSKEVCNDGISLVISSGKIPNYDMFIKLISKNDNFILYATESNVIKLPVELQDKLPNIDFLYVTVKGLNYE